MEHSPDGETAARERGRQRRKMRRLGTRHASLGRDDAECRDGANGWFSLGMFGGVVRTREWCRRQLLGKINSEEKQFGSQVKQRVSYGVETLAKRLVLDGLFKVRAAVSESRSP